MRGGCEIIGFYETSWGEKTPCFPLVLHLSCALLVVNQKPGFLSLTFRAAYYNKPPLALGEQVVHTVSLQTLIKKRAVYNRWHGFLTDVGFWGLTFNIRCILLFLSWCLTKVLLQEEHLSKSTCSRATKRLSYEP